MIELMILGFLAEGPLHGYELRRRMEQLFGFARKISDGTLYPAIDRMVESGLIVRRSEPGRAAVARLTLSLTEAGRARLEERLRAADGFDISDLGRWYVVLTFLSCVPEKAARDAVLQRRLDFLTRPASFFLDGDRPLRLADVTDPYRQGVLISARATNRAEREWLTSMLNSPAEPDPGPQDHDTSSDNGSDRKDRK